MPLAVRRGEVSAAAAGTRLDQWLAAATGASRRRASELCDRGGVRVDGRRAAPGLRLRAGQEVRWEGDPAAAVPPAPDPDLPLAVLLDDPSFVVIDKAAGVPTHPREPRERGTVVNALVARWPGLAGIGDGGACPALAHRLDRETSGALLAARTPAAWDRLRAAFAAGEVLKVYRALVHGSDVPRGRSDLPLRHMGPRGARMVAAVPGGRGSDRGFPARTAWRPLGSGGGFTLLEVRIETGLTHQVRAHLREAGHPVAGDPLYAEGLAPPPGLRRLFLHAARLAFPHPSTGERVDVPSPLPPDLAACLAALHIQPHG